jgi:hypothetical protein
MRKIIILLSAISYLAGLGIVDFVKVGKGEKEGSLFVRQGTMLKSFVVLDGNNKKRVKDLIRSDTILVDTTFKKVVFFLE